MESITQALVFAGGKGSRVSPRCNPKGCKSLIECDGKTFVQYVLENLIESGITNFVIVVNKDSEKEVREVVTKTISKAKVFFLLVSSDLPTEDLPYYARERLKERFLIVHGHHYVPCNHIKKMLDMAKVNEYVITAYDNEVYPITKPTKVTLDKKTQEISVIEKLDGHRAFFALRNPYIITKAVAVGIRDKGLKSFGISILEASIKDSTLGIVYADMPSEFDYDNELLRAREYVSARMK